MDSVFVDPSIALPRPEVLGPEVCTTSEKLEPETIWGNAKKRKAPEVPPSRGPVNRLCGTHDRKQIKYFCFECGDFICGSCVLSTHRGHEYRGLEDAEDLTKTLLGSWKKALRKPEECIEQKRSTVERMFKAEVQRRAQPALGSLEESFCSLRRLLDRREAELRAQIKGLAEKQTLEVQTALADAVKNVRQVQLSCQHLVGQPDRGILLSGGMKLRSKISGAFTETAGFPVVSKVITFKQARELDEVLRKYGNVAAEPRAEIMEKLNDVVLDDLERSILELFMVEQAEQSAITQEGIDIDSVLAQLRDKIPRDEFCKAIVHLCDEGHLSSTGKDTRFLHAYT